MTSAEIRSKNPVKISLLLDELGADEKNGLSGSEAGKRLAKHGKNILVPKKKREGWGYFSFLKEPMIWLLAGAAGIYFFLGETLDAGIMALSIVPIALIDIIIDVRTERALEKLKKISEPRVTVLRNGLKMQVSSEELVPGDIMLIGEGDVLMADCAVLSSSDLKLDESSLTGESKLVEKQAGAAYSSEVFSNTGALFAGTTVASGSAKCLVVTTGAETKYGKIGTLIADIKETKTPLQENIEQIVQLVGMLAIIISLVLVGIELWSGSTLAGALMHGIALAIAAIPEEFPVTFTLFLSLGMWSLAKNRALVKKLLGVETLGSVSAICSDKTGTMTTGSMTVGRIYSAGKQSDPDDFRAQGSHAVRFLEISKLACEKEPYDLMEKAIVSYVDSALGNRKGLKGWDLAHEYAFDARSKHMSHVWKKEGKLHVCAKGSLEGILERCKMTKSGRDAAHKANAKMAHDGMRVIALATKRLAKIRNRTEDEAGMEFLGLIGFIDPIRPGVREAVMECQSAGIRVVMVTGDHPLTAHAIAEKAGLIHDDMQILEGKDIEKMDNSEFTAALMRTGIFARVLPEQKLRIVEGLQRLGYAVAVTGDGINDAPALKKADIGVAMGVRGTEVAKESATLVLLDDNFATIVEAVRNGRRIYDNLQKAFAYLIAFHIPIFVSALVIPVLGMPMMLLPLHIVFLELVLHPTVALVFEQEPAEADIMGRKPRNRKAGLIARPHLARLIVEGLAISAATIAVYALALPTAGEIGARSASFTTLIMAQLMLICVELSTRKHIDPGRLFQNRGLLMIVPIVLVVYVALMYYAPFAAVFKISPLNLNGWIIALGAALAANLVGEGLKFFTNSKK